MPSLHSKRQWSLRKQILEYLSTQIEKGELRQGSLINVRELTEELQISRTPLREALAQMEVQGLVEIMPQRGVKIRVLAYDELLNIFEILGALESHVLRTVFDRITPPRIDRMADFNLKMARFIVEVKNRSFHEANIRLHRVFLDLCGNEELKSYISTLKLRVFGFALGSYRSRFKEAIVAEHDVFLGLLRQGEKEAAAVYLQHTHWVFNYPDNFIRSQPG